MNLIKKYIEYLKDNPEGYWFKRKLYGWGWVPVKWQGWFVIAIFILFILVNRLDIPSNLSQDDTDTAIIWFILKVILAVIVLIYICYKKGEKPRWQWGLEKRK